MCCNGSGVRGGRLWWLRAQAQGWDCDDISHRGGAADGGSRQIRVMVKAEGRALDRVHVFQG